MTNRYETLIIALKRGNFLAIIFKDIEDKTLATEVHCEYMELRIKEDLKRKKSYVTDEDEMITCMQNKNLCYVCFTGVL
jgi:hypothetical protein